MSYPAWRGESTGGRFLSGSGGAGSPPCRELSAGRGTGLSSAVTGNAQRLRRPQCEPSRPEKAGWAHICSPETRQDCGGTPS